jgi:predicted transcriptional regulator of viral defense system
MTLPALTMAASTNSLADWVDGLQARGRYTFARRAAGEVMGRDDRGLTKALGRLARAGRVVRARRGFYVIVPLEYRSSGAPPVSWFIDDLMRHLGKPYYAGLLTAASLHGAAHQAAQVFQVLTSDPLRPSVVGRARLQFLTRSAVESCPVVEMQTETGTMRVSSAELTALDLVRYMKSAGHVNHVATVLMELAEVMDPTALATTARSGCAGAAVVQRLGYLLRLLEHDALADALAESLEPVDTHPVALVTGRPTASSPTDPEWKVRINADVEPDL